MSDTQEVQFLPISASADGKRNAYSQRCEVLGQVMNYAACLWRQGVLANPEIRTPADWAPCADAGRCGKCNALRMREEETLKGHAIYFRDRNVFAKVTDKVREWVMPVFGAKRSEPSAPVVKSTPSKSMLDAMGDVAGYAEAISSPKAAEIAPAPRPVMPMPKVDMLPGESPLAYARRVRALSEAVS